MPTARKLHCTSSSRRQSECRATQNASSDRATATTSSPLRGFGWRVLTATTAALSSLYVRPRPRRCTLFKHENAWYGFLIGSGCGLVAGLLLGCAWCVCGPLGKAKRRIRDCELKLDSLEKQLKTAHDDVIEAEEKVKQAKAGKIFVPKEEQAAPVRRRHLPPYGCSAQLPPCHARNCPAAHSVTDCVAVGCFT